MTLHGALNEFRDRRGTETSNLQAKLAQQLVGIMHELLLQVFLDVGKAYDYLDRCSCMEIMRGGQDRPEHGAPN